MTCVALMSHCLWDPVLAAELSRVMVMVAEVAVPPKSMYTGLKNKLNKNRK